MLARIEGAPAGVKGISLFVVPKFLPDAERRPGERNGVVCGSIEHKMGIHGNATAVLNYDGAKGWLVGEEHRGLPAMFVMMNGARLGVAVQGLAISEVAYQNAAAYAKDRRQGRSLKGPVEPDKPADILLVHPDVRRMLLEIRAFNEAARALLVSVALTQDEALTSPDPKARQAADDRLGLMTPVHQGRVHRRRLRQRRQGAAGARRPRLHRRMGHGAVRPRRPHRHDLRRRERRAGARSRRPQAAEGRRPRDHGLLRRGRRSSSPRTRTTRRSRPISAALQTALGHLQQATMWLSKNGLADPNNAGAASNDYMHLFGLTALAYMWARIVKAVLARQAKGESNPALDAKLTLAKFFNERMLPETGAHLARLTAGAATVMALPAEAF